MTHKTSVISFQAPIANHIDIEECHLPLGRILTDVWEKSVASCPMMITAEPVQQGRYNMSLSLRNKRVDSLVQSKAHAPAIRPHLVEASAIRCPVAYKRFRDMARKDQFRGALLDHMHSKWAEMHGVEKAAELQAQFKELLLILDENGAVIFGELITKQAFQELIHHYNQILMTQGSKSWIHSYINLANHPDFLGNHHFNGAFLHPLLICLISYRIGGPIRIVDARGKDAEPISVLAQDNMLHIDNTPFNDEFKLILTWEKDKPSGPKGQNFVFIPGTHRGARNCFVDKDGNAWSTENASIFITDDAVQQVFNFQKKVFPENPPLVVEVHHRDKPLTTVFAAGSLVHHRYRTETGFARSCMIIAFHRASDNPGQFIASSHLNPVSMGAGNLNSFLFGQHGSGTEDQFLSALISNAGIIATLMDKLKAGQDGAEVLAQEKRKLTLEELEKWKAIATHAPTVEQLKIEKRFFPLGKNLTQEEFTDLVFKMMVFDKHGPLDLILYHDSHEEIRKWARNRIREMRLDHLESCVHKWAPMIASPRRHHLLSLEKLKSIANQLAIIATHELEAHNSAILDPNEKISQEDAFRSVKQLLTDLGEAIVRCESRQTFLSTSLFLFMACDTLSTLQEIPNEEVQRLGVKLLANYLATGILVEKQIQQEQAEAQ